MIFSFHATNEAGVSPECGSHPSAVCGLSGPRVTVWLLFFLLAGGGVVSGAAPRNLAAKNNGGTIVWYTSKDVKTRMGSVVDEKTADAGWRSRDEYLPQEIVFSFDQDRIALVDRIVINPKSAGKEVNWPKECVVLVSEENPFDGFKEAARFTLAAEAADQEFKVGRKARFLKLRMVSNRGGAYTSLGEVRIIEGAPDQGDAAPGLPGPEASLVKGLEGAGAGPSPLAEWLSGGILERERNDAPAEANRLQDRQFITGQIDPAGESDHFRIRVPDVPKPVLTLDLLGEPNVRSSVALLDAGGGIAKLYDPGEVPAQAVGFSWVVEPGERVLRLSEPPVHLVMIWDTSGSMRGSAKTLQKAVESYLDQVTPSERVKLVRFSKSVEVITPEFLSDPAELKAAARDRFNTQNGTSAYDAVERGVELLEGVEGNKGIILMTDGKDSSSALNHARFWKMLGEKRIRLYSIALGGSMRSYSTDLATSGERMMQHVALATDGRYFYAGKAEELEGLYREIAGELRARSTYHLRASATGEPGTLSVVATGDRILEISFPPYIELILDASASMKEKIGVEYKINIAKRVMQQIIRDLPEEILVALRFYGHRTPGNVEGDCEDSELVFPFNRLDKERLTALVEGVKAVGTTPLAYSLSQVGKDFGETEGEKIVIVVTDGKEECGGDPVAVVEEMLGQGLKLRINVVGFDLADEETKNEMRRIAEMTRGKFYDARDAKTLTKAIEDSLAVPYAVLDATGAMVADGLTGRDPIGVTEGIYTVVVSAGENPISVPNVRVLRGRPTRVALKKEGQEMGISVETGGL